MSSPADKEIILAILKKRGIEFKDKGDKVFTYVNDREGTELRFDNKGNLRHFWPWKASVDIWDQDYG